MWQWEQDSLNDNFRLTNLGLVLVFSEAVDWIWMVKTVSGSSIHCSALNRIHCYKIVERDKSFCRLSWQTSVLGHRHLTRHWPNVSLVVYSSQRKASLISFVSCLFKNDMRGVFNVNNKRGYSQLSLTMSAFHGQQNCRLFVAVCSLMNTPDSKIYCTVIS